MPMMKNNSFKEKQNMKQKKLPNKFKDFNSKLNN
jgi:hypothetical protein